MKILEVRSLAIPDVKVIRWERFMDSRGYFSESFRRSDIKSLDFFKDTEFVQGNESFSRPGTVRGLHFQWQPPMGKLVRTIRGRMIDMALDIRKNSPTFGKIILHDMPCSPERPYNEWMWLPPGFAHGNFFPEETIIEYFCSGEYNHGAEAGINPLAEDIDWSLCQPALKKAFDDLVKGQYLISEKDKAAPAVAGWLADDRSNNFLYRG